MALYLLLVTTEGRHWIDLGGAASGKPGGEQCHDGDESDSSRNEKGSTALTRKSWLWRKAARPIAIPNAKGKPTTSPPASKSKTR